MSRSNIVGKTFHYGFFYFEDETTIFLLYLFDFCVIPAYVFLKKSCYIKYSHRIISTPPARNAHNHSVAGGHAPSLTKRGGIYFPLTISSSQDKRRIKEKL